MKVNNYENSADQFAFQAFRTSLGYRLCIQSSTSKSRQNQFVTKTTGELVLNNLIDLQMFSKQVAHGRGK